GRADSETRTGAAVPAVVVTVMTSFTGVVRSEERGVGNERADTGNAKDVATTVNEKVVVAGVVPVGPVPVTVIVTVPVVAVDEAESAKVTVDGAVGVQAVDGGVGSAVTPLGRADSETRTGAAVPAVVVTVMTSFTGVVTP